MVVVAATFVVDRLNDYAEDHIRVQAILFSMEEDAAEEHIAAAQALREKKVTPEIGEDVAENRRELVEALGKLGELDSDNGTVARVRESLGAYEAAVDEQLRLIEAGSFERAAIVTEQRMDLRFEALHEVLEDASAEYEVDARRTALVVDAATYTAALLAAIMIVAIARFWRREQTRRSEQEALRRSGERFRSLVQNAADVITVLDAEGTIVYDSPAVERVLGYRPEERLGISGFEVIHPEDLELIRGVYAGLINEPGIRRSVELRARHKDGSWPLLEAVTHNLLDDPAVRGIVVNWRDITERKRAEETLKESEQRFRSTFEEAAIGMSVSEPDGRFVQVNRSLCEMLGYSEEELLGATFREITHPEDLDTSVDHAQRLREGEIDSFQTEKRYLHADGHVVWGSLSASAVRDSDGHLLYYIAQIQDITERREAEEEKSRRVRHAALRADVSAALAGGGPLPSILQRSTEAMVRHLDAAFARVWTLNEEGNVLELQASAGIYTHLDGAHSRVPVGSFKIGLIAQEGEPHLSNDVVSDPRVGDREWARGEGMVAFAGHPLIVEDRVVGVMAMFARHPLGEGTIEALDTVADIIAQGIERKRTEEALYRSEERFRSLVQNASDVILIMEPKGTVRYISPAVERVLGYKPEEVIGKDNFTPVHPDDMPRVQGVVGEAIKNPGTTFPVELRLRHADGSWRHLESRCTSLLDDPAVGGIVFNSRDVTERKRVEEELKHRASHDPLTNLPNRTLLAKRMEQALSHAQQRGGRVAVLFVDLDDFKVINDSLGHEMGDRMLVSIGRRLRALLRPHDTVAHFGGDEFVILLEDTDANEASRVAQRLVERMRTFFAVDGRELTITCTIGIALGGGAGGEQPADLLRRADMALYAAKAGGKNRYGTFEETMEAGVSERLEKEHRLRRAAEREGQFVVHYQPVVSLESARIVGFEALVRWNHPWRGLLLPAEFLPLAEQTGVIVGIGHWVLREACTQAKWWQERHPGEQPLTMSVNISARQLAHPGLVDDIAQTLKRFGLEPRNLVLEVTESAMMEDMEASAAVLRRLKDLGVRIAVDDFGKDHASLSYLKHLPVDILKIDRAFVAGLGTDQKDEGIVRAVIELARTLGLEVVAEGVESGEQLEHLRKLECELVQGNYLWMPFPAEKADELLATYNHP
jgi:diguanylate cyclase (GGDEF)-like protein/PAS domain S-box-containing protein